MTEQKPLPMKCTCCGMTVEQGAYHPYAACLMYMHCYNSAVVTANLKAVVEHGRASAPPIWQQLAELGKQVSDEDWQRVVDSRTPPPPVILPAGTEYVLLADMVDGYHPKYGKGVFATLNSVMVVEAQPAATPIAPIVQVRFHGGGADVTKIYSPGLPDGEHDLFCVPVGSGQWVPNPIMEPAATPGDECVAFNCRNTAIDGALCAEHGGSVPTKGALP